MQWALKSWETFFLKRLLDTFSSQVTVLVLLACLMFLKQRTDALQIKGVLHCRLCRDKRSKAMTKVVWNTKLYEGSNIEVGLPLLHLLVFYSVSHTYLANLAFCPIDSPLHAFLTYDVKAISLRTLSFTACIKNTYILAIKIVQTWLNRLYSTFMVPEAIFK